MGKIDKLIEEKCPTGVENKFIGDICTIVKGVQLNKDSLQDEGMYPVINGGINPSGYWNEYNFEENLITISQGGASAGYVNFIDTRFWAGAHCYVISECIDSVLYRYLFHFMKMNQINLMKNQIGAGIPSISLKTINSLTIPVPPIEIQKEIVCILDKFTELEAELQIELDVRKKQYEYYRDKLFVFSDSVVRKKLGDVIEVCMCKRILKNQTSYEGEVPFYQNGTLGKEATLYISQELFEELSSKYKMPVKGEVMLSTVGTIGRTIMYDGESAYFQDSNIVWLRNHEKEVTNEYLYWFCRTMPWKMHSRATLKHLHNYMIVDTEIPIPSFAEQKKIVSVLKILSDIVEDEKEGLPAEIKARHKQYEYYRDKLLTFKRKVV